MRQSHRADEKLFVDYAGHSVSIVDPTTGEVRRAQLFVAVLGASSYTFAEATWTQVLAAAQNRAYLANRGAGVVVLGRCARRFRTAGRCQASGYAISGSPPQSARPRPGLSPRAFEVLSAGSGVSFEELTERSGNDRRHTTISSGTGTKFNQEPDNSHSSGAILASETSA